MNPTFACSDETRALIRRANELGELYEEMDRERREGRASAVDMFRRNRTHRDWQAARVDAVRALCAEAGLRS